MTIFLKNKHSLKIDDFYLPCSVGKKGFIKKKSEGDNKTPIGTFNIEHLYYFPTQGCIALKKKDFLIMLKLIKKNTMIKIC